MFEIQRHRPCPSLNQTICSFQTPPSERNSPILPAPLFRGALERLVRIRRHIDARQQAFAPQRCLHALQRARPEHRKWNRMARETRVSVELDERFGLAPVLGLQRHPVSGEGAVAGVVLDGVDESEALKKAAVGLGGVGDQLLWRRWVRTFSRLN